MLHLAVPKQSLSFPYRLPCKIPTQPAGNPPSPTSPKTDNMPLSDCRQVANRCVELTHRQPNSYSLANHTSIPSDALQTPEQYSRTPHLTADAGEICTTNPQAPIQDRQHRCHPANHQSSHRSIVYWQIPPQRPHNRACDSRPLWAKHYYQAVNHRMPRRKRTRG